MHHPSFPCFAESGQSSNILFRSTVLQKKKKTEVRSLLLPVPLSNQCSAGQVSCSPQHYHLCRRDLQFLIQNHMAPPHGSPARVFLLLSFGHGLALSSFIVLHCPPSLLATHLQFKSQTGTFSIIPFPSPPTTDYTCQHFFIFSLSGLP